MSSPDFDPTSTRQPENDPQARILDHALQALGRLTVRGAYAQDGAIYHVGLEYIHGPDKDGADATFNFLFSNFRLASQQQTDAYEVALAGVADREMLQLNNPPLKLVGAEPATLKPVTMANIFNSLIMAAPDHALRDWAHRAIYADVQRMPTAARTKYMQTVVSTFWNKWNVAGLRSLIVANSTLDESKRLSNYQGESALQLAMNHKVRGLLSKGQDVDKALDMMADEDVIMPEIFCNVEMMSNPTVAKIVAAKLSSEDLFRDITSEARRNMAMLLLQKVLERHTYPSDRNEQNAAILKKVLFDDNRRSTTMPMADLIQVANGITQKQNKGRDVEKQQSLIPLIGNSSAHLVYCGEAVFRILAATSTSQDQDVENRNYAEIFDALMEPYYKSFIDSRVVTIADICARYPDADKDVVLKLRDTASKQGFSQASSSYRQLVSQHGSHVAWRRNQPGYGAIT